jgi:hypothetical protein
MERDQLDFAIVAGPEDLFRQLIRVPIYLWHHAVRDADARRANKMIHVDTLRGELKSIA